MVYINKSNCHVISLRKHNVLYRFETKIASSLYKEIHIQNQITNLIQRSNDQNLILNTLKLMIQSHLIEKSGATLNILNRVWLCIVMIRLNLDNIKFIVCQYLKVVLFFREMIKRCNFPSRFRAKFHLCLK